MGEKSDAAAAHWALLRVHFVSTRTSENSRYLLLRRNFFSIHLGKRLFQICTLLVGQWVHICLRLDRKQQRGSLLLSPFRPVADTLEDCFDLFPRHVSNHSTNGERRPIQKSGGVPPLSALRVRRTKPSARSGRHRSPDRPAVPRSEEAGCIWPDDPSGTANPF